MEQAKINIRKQLYYYVVGFSSVLFLTFMPMLGTDPSVGLVLPTTIQGWAVYIITKLAVAALNVLIFHSFVSQSEVNVQDNEYYKKAKEILSMLEDLNFIPRSPEVFFKKQYRTKGITIVITSIVTCISLTNAILQFDLISFISYLITVVMAIIFGIITMKNDEYYWTTEFYQYALYKKRMYEYGRQKPNNSNI